MATIFGVDSAYPSNTKLDNGYRLYDWIMRKNSFPAFWGRTISGENRITKEEVEFLRANECKIVLMFDDLTETNVASNDGAGDAERAINAAKELGVPQNSGIALFAVLKQGWNINQNWMISFARELSENGYAPGFLGNTDSSINFNFNRHCGHFVNETSEDNNFGAVFCATEPKTGNEAVEWTPYCPSDLTRDRIALWQNGLLYCGDMEINTTYARDISVLQYMW